MAIFNQPTVAPEVAAAMQLKQNANQLHNMLVRWFTTNYAIVWNNKAASPDKVVTALGTDATAMFTLSAALAEFLNQCQINSVPGGIPATWTYKANADGSIALTAVAPPSPAPATPAPAANAV